MEPPGRMNRARLPIAVLLVLTLQYSAFQDVRIRGVHPDALLLFAIAVAIVAGSESGAVVGFGVGLLADLFVQTPLGLSALTFALVAFAVGALQATLIRSSWWITPVTAFVASAAGIVLFVVLGAVLGQTQLLDADVPAIVAVVAVGNAVLALPAVRLASWAMAGLEPDRSYAR
ncbi:MAG TPA: rod shape-determining protein MreD [Acidimicrobiales bacterium]|nr:rod shape-determining protein MreD [Acidimicrobiales bacterium]